MTKWDIRVHSPGTARASQTELLITLDGPYISTTDNPTKKYWAKTWRRVLVFKVSQKAPLKPYFETIFLDSDLTLVPPLSPPPTHLLDLVNLHSLDNIQTFLVGQLVSFPWNTEVKSIFALKEIPLNFIQVKSPFWTSFLICNKGEYLVLHMNWVSWR